MKQSAILLFLLICQQNLYPGITARHRVAEVDSIARTLETSPSLYGVVGKQVARDGTCGSWVYHYLNFAITAFPDTLIIRPDSTFKDITGSAPVHSHWIDSDSALKIIFASWQRPNELDSDSTTIEMNLGQDTAQPWDEWYVTFSLRESSKKWYYRLKSGNGEIFQTYSTGVDRGHSPETFQLFQNYPNPFNSSTTIRFDLPKREFGRLAVYNTLGRQVQVLLEGEMEAGEHLFKIQLDNLPSGCYFYLLKTNSFFDVKRMLLLK